MKKHSLKIKITLWFTFFLILITILSGAVFLVSYQTMEKKSLQEKLKEHVEAMTADVENDRRIMEGPKNGLREEQKEELQEEQEDLKEDLTGEQFDNSDFYEDDVQLAIYQEDGSHEAGFFLYEELDDYAYDDSEKVRVITLSDEKYYCLDQWVHIRHGDDYYVRGITKVEKTVPEILKEHWEILFSFVFLIGIAFCGGYILTGRFLRPIKKISATAEMIKNSGDLTKRIEVGNKQDELGQLAGIMNEMFERLEVNFEADKQFASNAAHELRTPVAVILAQCEYGFDHMKEADELADVVAAVEKQGYKMSSLIETLLIYTRIQQQTEKYEKNKENLTELLQFSLEDFRLIAEKHIVIEDSLEEVTGEVNRELFVLMVNNLIRNAITYGKENGIVRVTLQREADGVILEVEDNGIGISKDQLPHIFERFYRGDLSRSTKGMGLGLSLVQQIAKYHNGRVEVSSEPGEGSIFRVILDI